MSTKLVSTDTFVAEGIEADRRLTFMYTDWRLLLESAAVHTTVLGKLVLYPWRIEQGVGGRMFEYLRQKRGHFMGYRRMWISSSCMSKVISHVRGRSYGTSCYRSFS